MTGINNDPGQVTANRSKENFNSDKFDFGDFFDDFSSVTFLMTFLQWLWLFFILKLVAGEIKKERINKKDIDRGINK